MGYNRISLDPNQHKNIGVALHNNGSFLELNITLLAGILCMVNEEFGNKFLFLYLLYLSTSKNLKLKSF